MSAPPADSLPRWTVVGFTGHRALPRPEAVAGALDRVLDRLQEAHGPLVAVASAAAGADTLFLESCARRGIPYFVELPFSRERFREDFSPGDWRRAEALLARAREVNEPAGVGSAQEGYLEAGLATVDRADVLIAVWNGGEAGGVGGTAEIVGYARSTGRPVIVIDPDTGEARDERMDRLARGGPASPGSPRAAVEEAFARLDAEAAALAPRTRQLVLHAILIHLGAAAVALTPLVFERHGVENVIALALEVSGLSVALALGLRHRRAHHEWMASRIGAELCRSYLALWDLPRTARAPPGTVSFGPAELQRRLRLAWSLDTPPPSTLESTRDSYLNGRIASQRAYYQAHLEGAERRYRRLRATAASVTLGAIAAGLFALALAIDGSHGWLYGVAKLLSLLLPLVSAGVLSLVVANDLGRRAVRYRDMVARLDDAARRLAAVRTPRALARIAAETETALLHEVGEWHALTRFAGEAH